MKSKTIKGNFGIEFYDVDVNTMTEAELAEAQAAQDEHGVIFFRDQSLTCEQHIGFAKRWGDVVINRFFEHVDGYEQIAMVRKEPEHTMVVGESWHTDHSYDLIPARGSILYAREVPKKGGDTLFANLCNAYDALPGELKKTLEGLRAVHSSRHVFSQQAVENSQPDEDRFHNFGRAVQDSIHPVVIVHPQSGKKALYVNPCFTLRFEGWSQEESRPLLDFLYQHALQPATTVGFRWQAGSIAFWDNRATWHQAQNDYPTERRLMHRITLQGCPLTGCNGQASDRIQTG